MKWLFVSIAIVLFHAETIAKERALVFLLAGQSNMFGKGEVAALPEHWRNPQDDVWIWQDNRRDEQGWTVLRPGFGNTDSHLGSAGDNLRFGDPNRPHRFGPEVTIGRTLADAYPNARIALIKHAMGGTDVESDWNPEWNPSQDGDYNYQPMYAGLRTKVEAATVELSRLGLDFKVAGVFWSQGGRDARDLDKAKNYEQNLRRMIERLRHDHDEPELPFIMARQELNARTTPYATFVRSAHERISASDRFSAAIPTEDIADTSARDAHWSARGQLAVGRRYAQHYLRLVQTLASRSEPWTPNDPGFWRQTSFHNVGHTGGTFDADVDALEAWKVTTGSMRTVVGVMDTGVDYRHPDLYLNIWLNEGEVPSSIREKLRDSDRDGLITFRDLNAAENLKFTKDVNENGYIDAGDLLNDSAWENGRDDDGNGFVDDLVGWDFYDNDNDAFVVGASRHGTALARHIGAVGNNGIGGAGLNWQIRMVPIRARADGVDRRETDVAAAFDYAILAGASIVDAGFRGSPAKPKNPSDTATEFSQTVHDALKRTQEAGLLVVAAAGNGARNTDVQPWYPQSYDVDNILTVAALAGQDDQLALSNLTNWGKATVEVASPTTNGTTSHALAIATGVAALVKSQHPDWSYRQLKGCILHTADVESSLVGKVASWGRINAARAVGLARHGTRGHAKFWRRRAPIPLVDAHSGKAGVTEAEIVIKTQGKITDLDIQVDMEHPDSRELQVELIPPEGAPLTLFSGRDRSSEFLAKVFDSLSGPPVDANLKAIVFDEGAAVSVEQAKAPYGGFYRPQSALGHLHGKPLMGTWKLRVTDYTSGRRGTLRHWAIVVRYEY